MKHENHQFIKTNEGREIGCNYNDVMCAECGEIRRLYEDGRIEVKKKGEMKDNKDKE